MPTATPPEVSALLAGRRRILITGGAGFGLRPSGVNIGGAVVRRLLTDSDALVFNLDKCGYASDLTSIEQVLAQYLFRGRDIRSCQGSSDRSALEQSACSEFAGLSQRSGSKEGITPPR